MEYHYKAFISYRHAELDTKVAVEIQNRIERYIIPGSIRRELGIKSIGRVFRDKDELPSTSDLNDNIKNAITNSDSLQRWQAILSGVTSTFRTITAGR